MGLSFRAKLFLAPLLISFLVLASACSSGPARSVGRDGKKPDRKIFILDKIEIDQEAVAAGAQILFSEPAPQRNVGLDRAAAGTFGVSDRGFCSIRARVSEPAIGLGGEVVGHRYDVLIFDGAVSDDGSFATANRGVGNSPSRPGRILMETDGRDSLWIQATLNGQKQAYRFHFNRNLIKTVPVAFPWK